MPSRALGEWRDARRDHLDDLVGVHALIDPRQGPGRRTGIQQFNLAFVVVLAAEWQGFARDLHDDATDHFTGQVARAGSPQGAAQLRALLTRERRLDRGNATISAISDDFRRLGVERLTQSVTAANAHSQRRLRKLEQLMTARNAIAHGNRRQMERLRREGVALNLAEAKRWRRALDGLAETLDRLVSDHLKETFRVDRPW